MGSFGKMVSIILSIVTERAFVASGLRYLPSRADTFVCELKLQSSSLLLGASHWPISRRQETVSPPRSSQPQSDKCVCVCMCVCVCVCVCVCMCSVAQSCLTLRDAMDCNPPGSSVYGILQSRILEWVAVPSLQGIFPTQGSNLSLLHLLHWQVDSLPLMPPGKPC